MSVFAAVSAEVVKVPTERSLLTHVQWLREWADRGLLTGLAWVDTRDMVADGFTKGSVDRTRIHKIMDGQWVFAHDPKVWQSSLATRPTHDNVLRRSDVDDTSSSTR